MRPRPLTAVRQRPGIFALIALLVLQTLPITVMAQQGTEVFVLPVASVSTLYQVNIQKVLRDTYRRKLQSTAQAPSFRWSLESGALPPGLRITPDGNVIGRPRAARAEPYQFNVRVIDSFGRSDELVLTFELRVEAAKIRLVSTDAPKLVPVSEESTANENGNARINLTDRVAPLWNANHYKAAHSSNVETVRVADKPRASSIGIPKRSALRSLSETSVTPPVPAPAPAADSTCPSCLPNPAPDEEKDFIIDARDGATTGKRRFKLHENARIIIINKNPFLFEYKVTLKDKPVLDQAIAEFFKDWPLFAGVFEKAESTDAQAAFPNCPELEKQFPALVDQIEDLVGSLSDNASKLEAKYKTEQKKYDAVAPPAAAAKKKLQDQNADCKTLCDTATVLRASLQAYKPDVEDLPEQIKDFKSDAEQLQRRVVQLEKQNQANPVPDPNGNCAQLLTIYKTLAAGFLDAATQLDTGVKNIIEGKKGFDAAVKTINDVFSRPDAFHKVYRSKDHALPTDTEITVERRELKEGAAFVKLVDAETINFGGGPRFAVAGGVVVSPFETINFKRVPALVDGEPVTVVGRDESSNSRILPILMLHGRLFEPSNSVISGVHFSLGVTAKPDDEGTNVEFLIGPSISFIEQRLFFTFGGYAGRRKQLEGNLVPGQVLPEGFTDDIPTSNHLVWKPGFALTYKFK